MNKKILQYSFLAVVGEVAYVVIIITFMQNAQKLFGNVPEYLAGITMLLLLVISAAISGGLVLGKPILMYFDGQKKEALLQFIATIGWLILFLIIIFSIFVIFR
jgi:hypothetical protein